MVTNFFPLTILVDLEVDLTSPWLPPPLLLLLPLGPPIDENEVNAEKPPASAP